MASAIIKKEDLQSIEWFLHGLSGDICDFISPDISPRQREVCSSDVYLLKQKICALILSDQIAFLPVAIVAVDPPSSIQIFTHPIHYTLRNIRQVICALIEENQLLIHEADILINLKSRILRQVDQNSAIIKSRSLSLSFQDTFLLLDTFIFAFQRHMKKSKSFVEVSLEIDKIFTHDILEWARRKDTTELILKELILPVIENLCVYPSNEKQCSQLLISLADRKLLQFSCVAYASRL